MQIQIMDNDSDDLPDNCIKGIPNSIYIIPEDGSVASHLFYFKDDHPRNDGWVEQSINWEDDDKAVEFTLHQTREDGRVQFAAGVAILPHIEIDHLSEQPTIKGALFYERSRLENNPYHGNLLIRKEVPNLTMKKWAASLATVVLKIIPQKND